MVFEFKTRLTWRRIAPKLSEYNLGILIGIRNLKRSEDSYIISVKEITMLRYSALVVLLDTTFGL